MHAERLIDLVNRLEPGSRVSATPEFELAIGRAMSHVSIFDASRAILDAGYQDQEAELSEDGRTISIYTNDRFTSWLILTIEQKPDSVAYKVLMGRTHLYTADVDMGGSLTIRESHGEMHTELHLPAQAARALLKLLRRQAVRDVLGVAKGHVRHSTSVALFDE